MSDCVFCKLIKGELPCRIIYEDAHTISFMDVAEDVDGHILVVPKKHVENIMDCDEKTLMYVMNTVKLVSNALTEKCGYHGVNLLHASGKSAEQSVPHFHMHVIPRKDADGIDAWPEFKGATRPVEQVYREIMDHL